MVCSYMLIILKCCAYSSLVPDVVNITGITCDAVNSINRCNVRWNVSVIVTYLCYSNCRYCIAGNIGSNYIWQKCTVT